MLGKIKDSSLEESFIFGIYLRDLLYHYLLSSMIKYEESRYIFLNFNPKI